MSDPRPRPPEHVHLLKALASLALDYLRWTQLVPMLFGWTFLILLTGALLLTNFQDASFSLFERGLAVYERVVGPVDAIDDPARDSTTDPTSESAEDPAVLTDPDGSTRFTDEDLMPVVLRGWGLLALVGWLFATLRAMLFGPREPARLAPKLRIAAYFAVGCSGLMWIAYLLGSETFNGGPLGWALLFCGVPLGVWLVSAWSLGFGHVVGIVQRHLHA